MATRLRAGLRRDDGVVRCFWCGPHEDYQRYHDEEWGRPVTDDRRLFEKLCLEGFQSGLSWLTILRKREHFRRAFHGFDWHRVARMGPRDVERLLQDASIVRHRGKIEATIANARAAVALERDEGSLAAFFWRFEPPPSERPRTMNHANLMRLAKTPTSTRLSKELKRRGFVWVGPTTCYAFIQAMGLVNDHLAGCDTRERIGPARARRKRP